MGPRRKVGVRRVHRIQLEGVLHRMVATCVWMNLRLGLRRMIEPSRTHLWGVEVCKVVCVCENEEIGLVVSEFHGVESMLLFLEDAFLCIRNKTKAE